MSATVTIYKHHNHATVNAELMYCRSARLTHIHVTNCTHISVKKCLQQKPVTTIPLS